jgi:23S rRNA A2030 N6-methylase RlmJ
VRPPFAFDKEAGPLLEWLWTMLSPRSEGGWSVRWLVPE